GAANAMPSGTGKGNVSLTGTLDLNGIAQTLNGLSGAGVIDNTSATAVTLQLGGNDQTSSFAGAIGNTSGAVAVTKIGTGTLTLSGTNNYCGATTVNGGTLNVTGSLGATAVTVNNGRT